MTNQEILSKIDHTLLKATATWEEIKILCDEAIKYKAASVCVPPCYLEAIYGVYEKRLNICTVIGFPLGYSETGVKVLETQKAIAEGASEIDMVINIGNVKNGYYDKVLDEVKLLKRVCGEKILKVIIETCYLTDDEKARMCVIVTEAGADFIKTSTGFGTAGATIADIDLFKKHIGPDVKIKAAGGIKTREDLEAFIVAGAARIGTSSAVKLLTGGEAAEY
jgi:deoxyribose-phosphate aldolase